MRLEHLYSLRSNFMVIGLTGRTGSGCSTIAKLLSGPYSDLKEEGLREFSSEEDLNSTFSRKYNIINKFMEAGENWIPFDVISYKDVLLLYLIKRYGTENFEPLKILNDYYRESKEEDNKEIVQKIFNELKQIVSRHKVIVDSILSLKEFNEIKSPDELVKLNKIFFDKPFRELSDEVFKVLKLNGYYRRAYLLHNISRNIRQSGNPKGGETKNISNLFEIASIINRIIKAKKHVNNSVPTRIVIDSLRNSLEIMFFKERYSGFYMLSTKDVLGNSRDRIEKRLPESIGDKSERATIAQKILNLDNTEYKTKDFSKGIFSSPDVENCIQKSDYHILNLNKENVDKYLDIYNPPYGKLNFLTREEQLLKLIALISQPGIITPSSVERSMQVANSAKLNSGCISRNVGATITDSSFHVKSIGWNDVAKGHTPCNLRNAEDIISPVSKVWLEKSQHYSPFEKGEVSDNSSYKYKNEKPGNFKEALTDYFKDSLDSKKNDLNGKPCAFCFKTVHNHYEGEANQVHTRSLHAEENAMLQITKLGGQGVENGILFTTASPCELCSKKAYQLGINTIYFIDPYPGISNDQILRGGRNETQPKMIPFSGAIGLAYHKCYDAFMSYKDEVTMTLEMEVDNKIGIQFKELLKSIKKKDNQISDLLGKTLDFTDDDVVALLSKALKGKK
ncbi:hypothetical protein ACFO3O_14565 [Dokdonia ponticola]|uniref:CMP/dCMP-type deaminase domain-containing protein n=1 Tax=Dokdonia ponticola TaxID=2041041 RepID=A0ABV9I006_9FLAO